MNDKSAPSGAAAKAEVERIVEAFGGGGSIGASCAKTL
jgi:hypothetical protein